MASLKSFNKLPYPPEIAQNYCNLTDLTRATAHPLLKERVFVTGNFLHILPPPLLEERGPEGEVCGTWTFGKKWIH